MMMKMMMMKFLTSNNYNTVHFLLLTVTILYISYFYQVRRGCVLLPTKKTKTKTQNKTKTATNKQTNKR